MSASNRIYLDNAATSFPKPEAVYDAIDHYHRRLGGSVGRGAYRQAIEGQRVIDRCRQRAAELLGAESADRIVFTFNGTDSLNLALHGLLKPGDHVVTSVIEHNSVLRPLRELERCSQVEVTCVNVGDDNRIDPADIRNAIRPNTKLIALIHASNVTGTIQPIEDVGEMARNAGVLFLVDAAQTAGHMPIDLSRLPIDLLACPGHKGLLGPLGTGLLYIRPGVEDVLRSLRQGGTGTRSEEERQPECLPDKYEAGNHNAPGLFGLEAGLTFLQQRTIAALSQHETLLANHFLEGLAALPTVRIFGPPPGAQQRLGVISIAVENYEPQELAAILDENFQIQMRAGFHCAPGIHRRLGTLQAGGTVRFSIGPFTTSGDIDQAIQALHEVAGCL